ncbi:hypothetical protein [Paraburkholderia tropica]|uniref:hypothetical protein n=1 Tax=Paraburkholderia tropica TaxID=92647 RepID=UPI002AB65E7E|nr:hypothetical protein [Paraburkholderia tropica]
MYDEQTFEGGVQARTVAGGIVQHPVVVTLGGIATELTLADAIKLRDGLVASIAVTEAAESAVLARNGHHFTIGKTMYGMAAVPSKLPAAPLRIDPNAAPVGFSVGAAFHDKPDTLLKWLLVGTRRRPLPDADTEVALAALGDLLRSKPAAHLVDIYESLNAKPELATFAADVRAAFIPS